MTDQNANNPDLAHPGERLSQTVEVFSDVVCPWCYIGEHRLQGAIAMLAKPAEGAAPVDVTIQLRAFQLDPEADPDRSEPVIEAYARKFGGIQRATEIIEHTTAVAAEAGLEFHLDRAQRANTLRAHRLIWWASQPDSPIDPLQLNVSIMRAYFTDGLNISSIDTLAAIADGLGADPDTVASFLTSAAGASEVEHDLNRAIELGVTAVPTFLVGGWGVPGAQDAETLARLIRRSAEATTP